MSRACQGVGEASGGIRSSAAAPALEPQRPRAQDHAPERLPVAAEELELRSGLVRLEVVAEATQLHVHRALAAER